MYACYVHNAIIETYRRMCDTDSNAKAKVNVILSGLCVLVLYYVIYRYVAPLNDTNAIFFASKLFRLTDTSIMHVKRR